MQLEKKYILKDGRKMPRLGQGTWHMGSDKTKRIVEIDTLRRGIELGMTLLDSAEMYGDGRAESLLGEAIADLPRNDLFVVSKVYPHNAGRKALERSLDASLSRLKIDSLDLYLLHWRGGIPLQETAEEMERMVQIGKIRGWGVSNLDLMDMNELEKTGLGDHCLVNQVLYHLGSRGVEYDLQPWLQKKNIALMAYSPLAEAGLLRRGIFNDPVILKVAEKHGVTPALVLLNFLLQKENVAVIPKASSLKHVEENARALDFCLSEEDISLLNRKYPSPSCAVPLDIV